MTHFLLLKSSTYTSARCTGNRTLSLLFLFLLLATCTITNATATATTATATTTTATTKTTAITTTPPISTTKDDGSIKFLLDQQASRYIKSRLKSSGVIHTMTNLLRLSEQTYTGSDTSRYLDCMEYYIHTGIFLETKPSLSVALRSEVHAAQSLAEWSGDQKNHDRKNILIEFNRHVKPSSSLDTTDSTRRIGTKLYAPEGRIYKFDLLVGHYMAGRVEARQALSQAEELIQMIPAESTTLAMRKSVEYYVEIMNQVEARGLEKVFELHERLDVGTDLVRHKHNNDGLRKDVIMSTFLSVPQWSAYKDTSNLLELLSKERYEPEAWTKLWWKRMSTLDPLYLFLLFCSWVIFFHITKWSLLIKGVRRLDATRWALQVLVAAVCVAILWKYRNSL